MIDRNGIKGALTPEATIFTLTIGKRSFGGMRVVSEWLGMRQLQDKRGEEVIVKVEDLGKYANAFRELLNSTNDSGVFIVSASPIIANEILDQ